MNYHPEPACLACQIPDPPPEQTCTRGRDHRVGTASGCPALRPAHHRLRPPPVLRHAPHPPQQATDMTPARQPRHPLHTLATAELTACRRQLEHAVAFVGRQDPIPAVHASLQTTLEDVPAEQDSRARERS